MLPDGVKKLQEKPLYKKINFSMLGQPGFKVQMHRCLAARLAIQLAAELAAQLVKARKKFGAEVTARCHKILKIALLVVH